MGKIYMKELVCTFFRSSLMRYLAVNIEGLRLLPEHSPPKMEEEDTPLDTLDMLI